MSNERRPRWRFPTAEIELLLNATGEVRFSVLARLLGPFLLQIAERELDSDLRPKIAASDLVQQTLIEAWKGWAGFTPQQSPARDLAAWLRQILKRNLADARRRFREAERRALRRERSLDGPESQALLEQLLLPDSETPSACYDRQETCELVLERLPRRHAMVLRWIYLEGWRREDVASYLNRSLDAVRMLEGRALRRLQELLEHDKP